MVTVDWGLIASAINFYTKRGFQQVSLPWIQAPSIVAITCQDRSRILNVPGHGSLIGSAEQSFIAEDMAGRLGRGRFVACTPCFRNEPVLDDLHLLHFMKVELYQNDVVGDDDIEDLVRLVQDFVYKTAGVEAVREVNGADIDLTISGIEIGSYGRRTASGSTWIYGTGIAEPRFSTALSRKG